MSEAAAAKPAVPQPRLEEVARNGRWLAVWFVAGAFLLWALGYAGLRYAFEGLASFAGYEWAETRRTHQARLELDVAELDATLAVPLVPERTKEDVSLLVARREHAAAELEEVRASKPIPAPVATIARIVIIGLTPLVMLVGSVWAVVEELKKRRAKKGRGNVSGHREKSPVPFFPSAEQTELARAAAPQHSPEKAVAPAPTTPLLPLPLEPPKRTEVTGDRWPGEPMARDPNGNICTIYCHGLLPRGYTPVEQPPPLPSRAERAARTKKKARGPSTSNAEANLHPGQAHVDTEAPPWNALPLEPGSPARVTICGEWKRSEASDDEPVRPRGSERHDDPYGRPMTPVAWSTWTDARDMLRHAVPRIPKQHLALVLAELAARAWPVWHDEYPDDARPALCIATLRAWCFGEATVADVLRARDGAIDAAQAALKDRSKRPMRMAAFAAAEAAAYATAYVEVTRPGVPPPEPALRVIQALLDATPSAWQHAVKLAYDVSAESKLPQGQAYADFHWDAEREDADRAHATEAYERAAKIIRGLVPYREEPAYRWIVVGDTVRIDHAELQRSGWSVVRLTKVDRH